MKREQTTAHVDYWRRRAERAESDFRAERQVSDALRERLDLSELRCREYGARLEALNAGCAKQLGRQGTRPEGSK